MFPLEGDSWASNILRDVLCVEGGARHPRRGVHHTDSKEEKALEGIFKLDHGGLDIFQ